MARYERTFRQRMYDAQGSHNALKELLEKCGQSQTMTGILAELQSILNDAWKEIEHLEPRKDWKQAAAREIAAGRKASAGNDADTLDGFAIPPADEPPPQDSCPLWGYDAQDAPCAEDVRKEGER